MYTVCNGYYKELLYLCATLFNKSINSTKPTPTAPANHGWLVLKSPANVNNAKPGATPNNDASK
jgi:hypothetical protein